MNPERKIIAGIDYSFIKNSGKKAECKATFYKGVAGIPEEGLEIYAIYFAEVKAHFFDSVIVQKTPWLPPTELAQNPLTDRGKKTSKKPTIKKLFQSSTPEPTRVDGYANIFHNTRCLLPEYLLYW